MFFLEEKFLYKNSFVVKCVWICAVLFTVVRSKAKVFSPNYQSCEMKVSANLTLLIALREVCKLQIFVVELIKFSWLKKIIHLKA